MNKILVAIAILASCSAAFASPCNYNPIGTVNEASTVKVTMTFCDYSSTAASTDCPDGGALIPKANITEVPYAVYDRDSGTKLLDTVTVADPNANPYSFLMDPNSNPYVAKCSRTATTYCTKNTDCPAGQTCSFPLRRNDQIHYMTGTYTWTGGMKSYQCDYKVTNLEQIP
jgi:hypothetical protein